MRSGPRRDNPGAEIEEKVDDFAGGQCSAPGDECDCVVDRGNERTVLVQSRRRAVVAVWIETSTLVVRSVVSQTPLQPHSRHRPDDTPRAHHPEGMKTGAYRLGTFDK